MLSLPTGSYQSQLYGCAINSLGTWFLVKWLYKNIISLMAHIAMERK